jgi:NADPH:quinone reductase-like Zn-dependent oxidoreductase
MPDWVVTATVSTIRQAAKQAANREGTVMKAIIYTEYGSPDVIQFKEVEKPTPKADEVLIKVHAASVNAGDWHYLRGTPWLFRLAAGLLKPKNIFLGGDVAGRVEAVGKNVSQFQPGDAVIGDLSACGRGSFAEYVTASETALVLKPANLSFEEAAAVPVAAVAALQSLRQSSTAIQSGQKVLINGASGGVGSFAVQIAKAFGAEVTAVCSTRNVERMQSIGADYVIDYSKEDFSQNGQQYDFILAANGYRPFSDYERALKSGGTYVMSGGTNAQMFEAMLMGSLVSMMGDKKMGNVLAQPKQADLAFIKELLEAGKVKPLIDRAYPLSEVAEAIRYLETGHAQGKVVITVAQ